MPNPEQAPQQDLPITSPDGQGLGYGAHEFIPNKVEEDEHPHPATEAAPPSEPPEEPPISHDQQAGQLYQGVNPEDNIQEPPAVHDPEHFVGNGDNAHQIDSLANK